MTTTRIRSVFSAILFVGCGVLVAACGVGGTGGPSVGIYHHRGESVMANPANFSDNQFVLGSGGEDGVGGAGGQVGRNGYIGDSTLQQGVAGEDGDTGFSLDWY